MNKKILSLIMLISLVGVTVLGGCSKDEATEGKKMDKPLKMKK